MTQLKCKYCHKIISEDLEKCLEGPSKYIECPFCKGLIWKLDYGWVLEEKE